MKPLITIFKIDELDFDSIKDKFHIIEFELSISFIDIGEIIEYKLNKMILNESLKMIQEKLKCLEHKVLFDDYISISIFDSNSNKLFKHENKRINFKTNSISDILNQPEFYPNYLDEDTIPWWKNEE